MANAAAIELDHPHAGAFLRMVDQHRLVVDEQHMMEVVVGGDDRALLAGMCVEDRQRGAKGVAERVMMVGGPVEAAGPGVNFALGQQGAESCFVNMDVSEPSAVGREG